MPDNPLSELHKAMGRPEPKQDEEQDEKPRKQKRRSEEEPPSTRGEIQEQILKIASQLPPAISFHSFAILPFPDGSALFIGYDITSTPRMAFILDRNAVKQLASSTRAEK